MPCRHTGNNCMLPATGNHSTQLHKSHWQFPQSLSRDTRQSVTVVGMEAQKHELSS